MAIVVKQDELLERYVKRFRDALDISDAAVYAVHQRIAHNHDFYIDVYNELSAKERAMIKDCVTRFRGELPIMLPNGRAS